MSRRRWVYTQGGEPLPAPVEVDQDWSNAPPRAQTATEELIYGGLSADGADISSRRKHREYMRANGLTTADDYTQTWARAQKERENIRQGGDFDTRERREAIGRAVYDLERGMPPARTRK